MLSGRSRNRNTSYIIAVIAMKGKINCEKEQNGRGVFIHFRLVRKRISEELTGFLLKRRSAGLE